MKIHHTKHHQGYTDKFNNAIKGTDLEDKSVEEILSNLDDVPEDIRQDVINNGGGFYNHALFWESMSPDGGGEPEGGILAEAITKTFGSFELFQDKFNEKALGVFGSGWTWLCYDENGSLVILQSKNQDNPISDGYTPLLGIDVWEHAYYLNYQNKRADYVKARWDLIDREVVQKRFKN